MEELINADFSERVVIVTDELPWIPSPMAGVERRPLDRIGGEVARATSLVRYAPASNFPAHDHALGEEFLVIDGVFSDEHGDYPAGTYVRNPPGSRHSPRTGPGCVIFVKLRQMPVTERERVVIDTSAAEWQPGIAPGHARLLLYSAGPDGETVTMERLDAGASLPAYDRRGGEELFLISGDLADDEHSYPVRTWIRSPDLYHQGLHSRSGAVYWVKRGHLPGENCRPQ
jgi:anti-sigma factor ChrR (cupin superfamily)